MPNYLRYIFNHRVQCRIFFGLALIMLISTMILGCNSPSSKQIYEDTQRNIRLEYPQNWNIELSERVNNSIVLQSNKGMFGGNSTRIEILVGLPTNSPINLEEGLEKRISNISDLYNLDSVTVIQPPSHTERGDHEIVVAIISIPTMSIPENSPVNQLNQREPNVSQTIYIYTIRNNNNLDFDISVYRGNSDELNKQAEEIVNSIQFIAP